MVHAIVRRAHAPADARLAGDRTRRLDADSVANRQRQNADGVSLVPRPSDVLARPAEIRAVPCTLCVPAQSACRRRRAQPTRAPQRYRASGRTTWRRIHLSGYIDPDWRHAPERTRTIPATTC